MKKAWKIAADQLGLTVDLGRMLSKPKMHGLIGDVSVVVVIDKPPNRYVDMYYTSYTVLHSAAGPPVRIKRKKTYAKVSRWFGQRDVEVGDPTRLSSTPVSRRRFASI